MSFVRTMSAAMVAALVAVISVGALTADATEPPPLSEQPRQAVTIEHISPEACTLEVSGAEGQPCIEIGEQWQCPVGLSRAAVFAEAPTYAETVAPDYAPYPHRESHCLFVGFENAYPVGAPFSPLRPTVVCTHGLAEYLCQTAPAPVAPTPEPTPEPTPDPTPIPTEPCPVGFQPLASDTYVGTTVCVPEAQPPISFTG